MVLYDMKFEVANEDHSMQIQKLLFKLGFEWGEDENKVSYTNIPFLYARVHSMYISCGVCKRVFNANNEFKLTDVKGLIKMINVTKPHKHAELIKAWADGAIIQFNCTNGEWKDSEGNDPSWNINQVYRIKPEEPTDVEKYEIDIGDIWRVRKQHLFVVNVTKNSQYEDGWTVTLNNSEKMSKEHLVRIKAELLFRRGVVDRLNER